MDVVAAQDVPEVQETAPKVPLPEDELWFARIENASQTGPSTDDQTVSRAKELLSKQEVSNQRLQETAEVEFLEELGLVADAQKFKRMHVQANTKLLYAQQKYNLLREESEGFGKAINALFQCGKAGLTLAGIPFLLRELRALIGYFDLDPIRLADIVLDAFAADPKNLAFLELMQLFPQGSLPHILGFKFKLAAEDQTAAFPGYASSLSLVAAQLIKAGYIPLDALLPHLQPSDHSLEKSISEAQLSFEEAAEGILKSSLSGNKTEGPQEVKSLMATAVTSARLELAALPLEDAAFAAVAEGNHKLALTEGLLQVGAWPQASRMLVWLSGLGAPAAAHAGVRAALCQLLAQRLEPFHAWLHPHGLRGGPSQADGTAPDISGETMDILHALGFRVGCDAVLFTKVVRMVGFALARHVKPTATSKPSSHIVQLQDLLQTVVLPGLQLVPANAAVTTEVWKVLQLLPYRQRFCMYAKWQAMQREQVLLYAAACLALREVKRVLRRISKDETTPEERAERKRLAGIAAKAAHANPLSALDTGVAQATGYGREVHNEIVETLRYVTPMGHDVLTYLILDQLASPHRKKLNEDGLNVSSWLQNLASFIGLASVKCPDIDLHAILEYSTCRLKKFHVSELVVVNRIITSLSGIAMVHDLNSSQLEATAGSETLRAESVAMTTTVLRSSEQRRNATRLLNALQKGPEQDHLLVPLLVLLAQQRQHIATQTPNSDQLKLLLELFDQCSETLSQYIKFLQKYLSRDTYERLLPSLDALISGFGLDVEVAWQVYRHLTTHLEPDTSASPEDGEVDELEGSASKDALAVTAPSTPPITDAPTHIEDAGRDARALTETERRMWQHWQADSGSEGSATPMDIDVTSDKVTWGSLVEASRRYLSDGTKSLIRPDFYLAFWSLRYYDIHVPEERYKEAMAALRKRIVDNNRILRDRGALGPREHEALSDEQARLQGTLERLSSELAMQKQHVEKVMARLHSLTEEWNIGASIRVRGCQHVFVQDCVLPRCLYSPEDAAYVGTYLSLLSRLAIDWPIAFVYNSVFSDLLNVLACITEREAANLAVTLKILLSDVTRWQENPEIFGKECAISKGWSLDVWGPAQEYIAYSKFVLLYAKWLKLTAQMMVHCLRSGVYSQMRNAIIVLDAIKPVFPRSKLATEMLLEAMRAVLAKETREDLKMLLTSYINWLERESKPDDSIRNLSDAEFNKEQPPPEVATARSSPDHPEPKKPEVKKERAEVMRERAEAEKEPKVKKEREDAKALEAAAPGPSVATQPNVKTEPAAEKPQAASRKPPAVPAPEGGKEKGREKEHRKREPIPAQRTASIPAPSKKRPAQEPTEGQQPPTKEAKHAGAEAKGHTANGRLPERKSPQSAEKRKPSALSPDAEAYVPRSAREGSSKPEEAAQPVAASAHRHHKRARTEEEPKKEKKKDKDRSEKEHDRSDKDRSEKDKDRSEKDRDRSERDRERPNGRDKGREMGPLPAPQDHRQAPSSAAVAPDPALDIKPRAASRQPEGSSPKPHAAEADADGKRESRRDKEKRADKEKKAEKEKERDRGREASKPSSRQGEEGRKEKESRHDKPPRAAEKDSAPLNEAKRSAERPSKREPAEDPAPSSRKASTRRSDTGEAVGDGQSSRHRKAMAAEAHPSPRSEAAAAAEADRRDRDRQPEDSSRQDRSSARERSVPRETGRRERARIPTAPVPEGPRPLGAGLQNRLSRGPAR